MACGYAPYGEDIRYHLTNPHFFNYEEYNPFIYHKHLAYYTPTSKTVSYTHLTLPTTPYV